MRAVLLAAALLLAPATASYSQSATPASSFTVQNVAQTPQAPILLDSVSWRCNAENLCVGTGGQSQPATRACRRVAARVGAPLSTFTYKGTTLTSEQLATCNQAAVSA